MDDQQWLAARFEENRGHLRAVAYRMLGSPTEADDAVQDTWVRLSRAGTSEVENLGGWMVPVLVNGEAGVVVTIKGRPFTVMAFTVTDGKIVAMDIIADPERVRRIAEPVLAKVR